MRGEISIAGTPIRLGEVMTPSYVQAGREDHIAPARSVWKMTEAMKAPMRFLMAGSGHIAGVVNPPSSGKHQYWPFEGKAASTEARPVGKECVSPCRSGWPPYHKNKTH